MVRIVMKLMKNLLIQKPEELHKARHRFGSVTWFERFNPSKIFKK